MRAMRVHHRLLPILKWTSATRRARQLVPAALLLALAGCSLFYGPTTVRSGFVSARLGKDASTAVFTYQRLVYEPARGLAAFPDGGVPRYREDHALFGTCDVGGGQVRILISEKNREFQPGQGRLYIVDLYGDKVLLSRGGQLKNSDRRAVRYLLTDVRKGRPLPLDLAGTFAERKRAPGIIRMIDGEGTLLFESPTLAEADGDPGWTRNPSVIPELWVRRPDGRLRRLAATRHFVAAVGGEVYFWDSAAREHVAVDIETGARRPAPEFRSPSPPPTEVGLSIAGHRRTLLLGKRDGDKWNYREIPIQSSLLK
jgi:hypothetical protein